MKWEKLKVLMLEDDVFKGAAVKRALENCGLRQILQVENQEDGFAKIYEAREQDAPVGLIVTDMQYPLEKGKAVDKEAGSKLIERMREENIDIPVILCSSVNYKEGGILGNVWYSDLRDLNQDFRRILEKMR